MADQNTYMGTNCNSNETNRQRCEVYTRVMGYHRPVSAFNQGKKSEYYSRVYFKESKSDNAKFNEEFSGCIN